MNILSGCQIMFGSRVSFSMLKKHLQQIGTEILWMSTANDAVNDKVGFVKVIK